MSKAHLTAVAAALALGAFAPRLAAQDTSAAGVARPDTSGYTGAGGVDTSARPGRVGATDTAAGAAGVDTAVGAAGDTSKWRKSGDSAAYTPQPGAATDSTAPMGAGDTTGIPGRRTDSTKSGAAGAPRPSGADSSWSADSAAAAKASP